MGKQSQHPFLMLEHRVVDSPAFADLRPTSKVLLFLLTRQGNGKNNGHLQATFAWCSKYGIGSTHTLSEAIAELLSHGFIYKTRSHGANKTWARYALTWLPIKQGKGLFLAGFKMFAWRDWTPDKNMPNGKSRWQKLLHPYSRKCTFTPQDVAETATNLIAETATYEDIAIYRGKSSSEKKDIAFGNHPQTPKSIGENTRGSLGEKIGPQKKRRTWGPPSFMSAYFERRRARGLFGAMMGTA